ncbi:MAG: GNAT family N-acetyltransferase [Methanomassiliicoccales archaeon]|nr:GNAT family N-acetyltransferase [Methanomassiliicoccales archaeon]
MEKARRRSKSELYIALRYKARARGISRVDMIRYQRDLGGDIPVVKAKVPVDVAVLTDPSQAAELAKARLWEGFEERAWRKRSPERLRRLVEQRAEAFQARLADGEMAVVALRDGEYVGAAWFCLRGRKGDPVVESSVALEPKEAFLYQSQVDRSLRGNRIYSMLVSVGLRRLKELGYQKVSVHIEDDNAPSIAAVESLGFRPVLLIRFRRLFSSVRREEAELTKD